MRRPRPVRPVAAALAGPLAAALVGVLAAVAALPVASAASAAPPSPPAPLPPPGPVVPPLLRVAVTGAVDTTANTRVSVTCPATRPYVLGTGVATSAGAWHAHVTDARPGADLSTVTAAAHADHDDAAWSLTVYAVCGQHRPRLHRVRGTAGTVPLAAHLLTATTKVATATCGPGSAVVGTGFAVTGDPDGVSVDRVEVAADLSAVTVAATAEPGTPAADWGLTAFAVCAESAPGTVLATDTGHSTTTEHVDCPAGTAVTGLGGVVDSSTAPAALGGLVPDADLGGGSTLGDGWYLTVTAQAVCVPV
jgi:hypothetical protein